MRLLVLVFVLGAMADACGAQAPAAHEERASTGLARQGELQAERQAGNPPKDSDTAYHAEPKSPFTKHTFDTGWWARAHWTAAAFDYATTGNSNSECLHALLPQFQGRYCGEADPLGKVFIGNHPPSWRLALGWTAESVAVSFIPNRKVRRIVQVGLITSHIVCGVQNLRNWH